MTCCVFSPLCATLSLFLIVLSLVRCYGEDVCAAIGAPSQYSRWLGPGGELKFCITNSEYSIGLDEDLEKHFYNPAEFMDDYLMLHSCPDTDFTDVVDEANGFGCTHCKAVYIYSCYGQNQTTITLPEEAHQSKLCMFRMNFVDVDTIAANTFSGLTINNIRIQFGGLKHLEPKAFYNISKLLTLTINQNQITDLGKLSQVFGGLTDMTILNLDQNQIRTWDSEDMEYSSEPLLPSLDYLSLAGNPFDILNSSSFSWLRHSPIKYLNLRESRISFSSKDHGTKILSPVSKTLEFLDLGSATMGINALSYLLHSLLVNDTGTNLRGLGLSNLGLNQMPLDLNLNDKLQYLSLHGNSFHAIKRNGENNLSDYPMFDDGQLFEDRAAFFPAMPELLELDLRDCKIKCIHSGAFEMLPKLQVLMIGNNELSYFEDGSFRNLNYVTYLDLSHNQHYPFSPPLFGYIYQPDSLYLDDLTALQVVDFSHSKIDLLMRDTFAGLGASVVNLSLCQVEMSFMENEIFENLTGLEMLDLSMNPHIATMFTPQLFKGLRNLRHLHLAACNLDFKQAIYETDRFQTPNVSQDPFSHFGKLRTLNLTGNNIKFITETTFSSLRSVEIIDLAENRILPWSRPVFKHNKKLSYLRLNRNRITFMTEAMLNEFSMLDSLDMSENPFMCDCYVIPFLNMASNNLSRSNNTDSVEEVRTFMLQNFVPFIKFRNNTWDSQLPSMEEGGKHWQVFIQTALSKNIQKVLESHTYYYEGESWNFLDLTEEKQADVKRRLLELNVTSFVNGSVYIVGLDEGSAYSCLDTEWSNNYDFHAVNESYCLAKDYNTTILLNYDLSVIIAVTLVISFVIGACLFTLYRKWWYIRYYALQLKNATVMSFMSQCNEKEQTPVFQYDVFLSFCDVNRAWVLDNLIPNLEDENDLKVCLHERDFQVGVSILENIIASMDRSRCILLVVSLSFVKSQWCQFELHVAQHRLLETRREELVLILLEDIPRWKRPKMLHFLMLTKTYIVWPKDKSDDEARRLFWKRLKKAVAPNSPQTISIV